MKAQDWLEGAAAKASKVAVKAQGNSAEIAVDAQDWLHGAEDLKDVQDMLAGAAAKNEIRFIIHSNQHHVSITSTTARFSKNDQDTHVCPL